jgi:hypothetical protein
MPRFLPLAVAAMLASGSAAAQTAPPTPVIAIVEVPAPWYAPRALIVRKMRETLPQYRNLPGLVHKSFSFAEGGARRGAFGGVYLWSDRAAAEAWFDERWFARVRSERGVEPRVRLIDAPQTIGEAPPEVLESGEPVATLIDFGAPAPALALAPGLWRASALAGGQAWLALWSDRASAERWLAAPGRSAQVEWFATPILATSTLPQNRLAVQP